jgi:hypothetical protein
MGWLRASKGYTSKREFGKWHLTDFSGGCASFLTDFSGTFKYHPSLNPQKGPPVKKLLNYAPQI